MNPGPKMTWAQLVSKIVSTKKWPSNTPKSPDFFGVWSFEFFAKLWFSLVTSGWSLQQESPFLAIFTLKIRWRREMAGFGPTGGWGPWRVGIFFLKILVAAALHHQNNGRNERHVMQKYVRYRWYLHIYAHVSVWVDVRYARLYDLYIFVSLYHLDLERYSGISRDTTLYQNPPPFWAKNPWFSWRNHHKIALKEAWLR